MGEGTSVFFGSHRRGLVPPGAGAAGDRHADKVARVVRQLRGRAGTRPVSLKKRAVSHQVPKPADRKYADAKIDLSDLVEILALDVAGRTCTAEPGVTFAALVAATLPHGLVPAIVPELKTITIGGAVSGCSLESMSFKYGGFHDTCLAYEVVTAQGEVLRCTPDNEHQLIFQMLHGSFGTLGVLTQLTFALVPAKPFVHVVYERHATFAGYQAAIDRYVQGGSVDFMDGFIHSPTDYVLNLGRFVDAAPYTNRYDWVKVYYKSTQQRRDDFLRAADYFFRYDRGVTNVHPKSAVGRLLIGKFVGSAMLLRLAEKLRRFLPADPPAVSVDLFVPFSKAGRFLAAYETAFNFYPLWCVPYRRVRDYPWIAAAFYEGLDDRLFLDLAIYGMKQPAGRNCYQELEAALQAVNGIKTLISHNYYDEATFWRIFNRANYQAVKERTDPDNIFRDLYTKTCLAPRGLDAAPALPGGVPT